MVLKSYVLLIVIGLAWVLLDCQPRLQMRAHAKRTCLQGFAAIGIRQGLRVSRRFALYGARARKRPNDLGAIQIDKFESAAYWCM